MPIDASILQGLRPVQFESPLNQLAAIMQIRGQQQQAEMGALQLAQAKRNALMADEQQQRENAFRAGLQSPQMQASQAALSGGGGPTVSNAARVQPVDPYRQMMFEAMQAKMVSPLDYAKLLQREQKIKDYKAVRNPDGSVSYVGLTEDGKVVQTGQTPFEKPEIRDFGGTVGGIDPISGKVTNYGGKTATPDAVMADARARERLAFDRQQANRPGIQQTEDGIFAVDPRTATGVPVRHADTGAPLMRPEKPLAPAAAKQLTEARDNAVTIDRLASSFKPEYASKGVLGLGAETSMTAKGVLGTDRDAVDWWKNYRKQAELIERHALFGAALTPGEQASWRSADIGPGMDPRVVARNLETRRDLAAKVLETTRQDLIDQGYPEKRINPIASRNANSAPRATQPEVVDWGSLK